MGYEINRTHAKIVGGYLFLALFFSFVLITNYHNSSPSSMTGYVVFEGGTQVSTEKMDPALVQEINSGNNEPKVVVILKEDRLTDSPDLEQRKEAIQEIQQQVISFLEQEISVSLPQDTTEILTSEGTASEEQINREIQEDKLPDAKEIIQDNSGFEITQQYDTVNALAGQVKDPQTLIELTNNDQVEKILLDYPVSVSLDQSTSQIGAPKVWNLSVNGTPIDGNGETVCIIDTGIDYTHPALGNCSPSYYQLDGTPASLETSIESDHPYANNFDHTWTITQENYTNIAVHFSYIHLEQTSGQGDTLDRVYVYDQYNRTLAIYKGSLEDIWTPSGEGNTIYVRLVSDESVVLNGFVIDQTLDGTTNTEMNWNNCSKVIGGWDTYNNDADPKDDHGHGTHVAGIIASEDPVYRGVAPGAKLVAVKALSASGSGYSSDVVAGIDWCNGNAQKYGISIISMSLGCDGYGCTHYQDYCTQDLTSQVINQSYQRGISVFIAAGNSGWTNGISNPACVPNAIPVGGVNENDAIVYNRGNLLKILAPGTNIMSTTLNSGWRSLSGTSMATPHAAGSAALLQQYWKQSTGEPTSPSQLQLLLFNRGKTVYDSGSGLNFSRIDIYNSILPKIIFSSDNSLNNSIITNDSVEIKINSELPLASAQLFLTFPDANQTILDLVKQGQEFNKVLDNLTSGEYSYYVIGTDVLGLNATTETRTLLINLTSVPEDLPHNQTILPLIIIHSPQNNSYLSQNLSLNLTLSQNLTFWSYSINNSLQEQANNFSELLNNSREEVLEQIVLSEGEYLLNIEARDLVGNNYSESIFFTIDQTSPNISLEISTINESEEILANVSDVHLNQSSVFISINLSNNLTLYSMNLTEQGLYQYHLENQNSTTYYSVSAQDLAGNSYLTPIQNITWQTLNPTLPSNNTDNSTQPLSGQILTPLNNSMIEVGNLTFYNANASGPSNLSYEWNFGDGTILNGTSGYKQYNSTGSYNLTLNISSINQSLLLVNLFTVNDTYPPQVQSITYLNTFHLGERNHQQVNATFFDYSGLSSVRLYLNGALKTLTTQNGSNYIWNLTSLTAGNYSLRLEAIDNFTIKHGQNFTYNFTVTSCSDGIKNGDETGTDCGGHCANCTIAAVVEVPVTAITETIPEPPKISIQSTEVNQPLTTSSVATESTLLTTQTKPVNWTNDVKETKITKQEQALYIIGGLIIALLSLYTVLLWKSD
ncbi:MAG: S8 family serine peptidase [Candidatus Woesearchaeota archaeon]